MKNEVAEKPKRTGQPARWPFDPMQPGDHKPVQKQTGAGKRKAKGGGR